MQPVSWGQADEYESPRDKWGLRSGGGGSGIREQKKRKGAFDTRVCHIDPRYRKHPISNSGIKPHTKQTASNKVTEPVPLSICWRGKHGTGVSSTDIHSKTFVSSTQLSMSVSNRFNIRPHKIIITHISPYFSAISPDLDAENCLFLAF